eukprot:scaffold263514_cov19-Tisochrysis_lutea.AAC.1
MLPALPLHKGHGPSMSAAHCLASEEHAPSKAGRQAWMHPQPISCGVSFVPGFGHGSQSELSGPGDPLLVMGSISANAQDPSRLLLHAHIHVTN